MSSAPLEGAIRERLATVLDPCSVHNGTRMSFVDLGMIDAVDVSPEGDARVRLVIDDPVCIYMVDILTSVRDAVLEVPGVRTADVEIDGGEVWTPDRLTVEARARMERWRIERARRLPMLAAKGRIA